MYHAYCHILLVLRFTICLHIYNFCLMYSIKYRHLCFNLNSSYLFPFILKVSLYDLWWAYAWAWAYQRAIYIKILTHFKSLICSYSYLHSPWNFTLNLKYFHSWIVLDITYDCFMLPLLQHLSFLHLTYPAYYYIQNFMCSIMSVIFLKSHSILHIYFHSINIHPYFNHQM